MLLLLFYIQLALLPYFLIFNNVYYYFYFSLFKFCFFYYYYYFEGFLSVPALRNAPTQHMGKRDIVSSPAKSERMARDSSSTKLPARRLSQDSGIVAGRLFNGAVSESTIKHIYI